MPRKQLETHFFYGTGDDEIQVDSNDRKFNKEEVIKVKQGENDELRAYISEFEEINDECAMN